jgi:hypothetical protein
LRILPEKLRPFQLLSHPPAIFCPRPRTSAILSLSLSPFSDPRHSNFKPLQTLPFVLLASNYPQSQGEGDSERHSPSSSSRALYLLYEKEATIGLQRGGASTYPQAYTHIHTHTYTRSLTHTHTLCVLLAWVTSHIGARYRLSLQSHCSDHSQKSQPTLLLAAVVVCPVGPGPPYSAIIHGIQGDTYRTVLGLSLARALSLLRRIPASITASPNSSCPRPSNGLTRFLDPYQLEYGIRSRSYLSLSLSFVAASRSESSFSQLQPPPFVSLDCLIVLFNPFFILIVLAGFFTSIASSLQPFP